MGRDGAVLVLALALAGCASQVPPTGGPPDTDPPAVTASSPAPGDVRFAGGTIRLEFSERVDRRSLQESAFLSPSAGLLRFDWSGSSVEISVAETLRANTTYILTVGTDLKDARNNRLAEAFLLPFSTGDLIDSCGISGRVRDGEPGGVMVFAYAVAGGRGDTLNPGVTRPDYLTQTAADGSFRLRSMAPGTYRVMAVRDVFRNLLYDPHTDACGLATGDIALSPPSEIREGILLRLAAEDTLPPRATAAVERHRRAVSVRFTEPVLFAGSPGEGELVDTLTGGAVPLLELTPADTSLREYLVRTAPRDSGATWRLRLPLFHDLRGNPADSAGGIVTFTGTGREDTLPPGFRLTVGRDSIDGVFPRDPLAAFFDEPVDTAAFAAGFTVLSGEGLPLSGRLAWTGRVAAAFLPAEPFRPGIWYSVSVSAGSVADDAGNRRSDSVRARRFRFAGERDLGSIEGRIDRKGLPEGASGATLIVEAIPEGGSGALRVPAGGDGTFLLDRLRPGRYLLAAFADIDGDGDPGAGRPRPLRFAEPYTVYGDTLRIRPGWPVGGVLIGFDR